MTPSLPITPEETRWVLWAFSMWALAMTVLAAGLGVRFAVRWTRRSPRKPSQWERDYDDRHDRGDGGW